jgi:hypothetical protein
VEIEAIIRIQTQIVIIILVQDVIMGIAEVIQVLVQAHIQTETQTHRRNKQLRGGIIVIRVRLQRLLHLTVVQRHLLVVHHLEEVHQAVVEVEVQDKLTKH